MRDFLKGCITDAQGRAEAKMILGIALIVFCPVYLIVWKDLSGAEFIGALGGGLIGATAVADGFTDSKSSNTDDKKIPSGE